MTEEQKKLALHISKVTAAFAIGTPIECKYIYQDDSAFERVTEPSWEWQKYFYRIEEAKKPTIDWRQVHRDFNVLVLDYAGAGILANVMLEVSGDAWVAKHPCSSTVQITYANSFASFHAGTCAWKDSLVTRPGWVLQTNGEVK